MPDIETASFIGIEGAENTSHGGAEGHTIIGHAVYVARADCVNTDVIVADTDAELETDADTDADAYAEGDGADVALAIGAESATCAKATLCATVFKEDMTPAA